MKNITSSKQLKQFFNEEFSSLRKQQTNLPQVSKYFGEVGSTETEDIDYEKQLDVKLKAIKNIFSGIVDEKIIENNEIMPSPKTSEYRFKMEFVCSFDPIHEPHNRLGQRKKRIYNWVVDMDECNLIDNAWFKKLRQVYESLIEAGIVLYDLKKGTGELRYMIIKQYENQAMLIILTKSKLNEKAISKACDEAIKLGFKSVYWAIQDSLGDVATGEVYKQYGDKYLKVPLKLSEEEFNFFVALFTFFQNNIGGFTLILDYIKNEIKKLPRANKLLDLYCGVGTIGICLASNFKEVVSIDIDEKNVKLINENLRINNISNLKYFASDVKDFAQEVSNDSMVVVDPPRVGLENRGVETLLAINSKYIVYISCNPISQGHDVNMLCAMYKAIAMRTFDLFPHTYHMENVIILERI